MFVVSNISNTEKENEMSNVVAVNFEKTEPVKVEKELDFRTTNNLEYLLKEKKATDLKEFMKFLRSSYKDYQVLRKDGLNTHYLHHFWDTDTSGGFVEFGSNFDTLYKHLKTHTHMVKDVELRVTEYKSFSDVVPAEVVDGIDPDDEYEIYNMYENDLDDIDHYIDEAYITDEYLGYKYH
jgi:hypothetical protein